MTVDTRLESLRLAMTGMHQGRSTELDEIMKRAHHFEAFLNSTPAIMDEKSDSLAAEKMQLINEEVTAVRETILSWGEKSSDLNNAMISLSHVVDYVSKHLHPLKSTLK